MHPASSVLPWQGKRVGTKLMLITGIFAAAILVLILSTIGALRSQQNDAAYADAIGRQRFLIQRYVADAINAGMGMQTDYLRTKQVLDSNLSAMLAGGPVVVSLDSNAQVDLPPPVTEEIATALRDQRLLLNRLSASIDRYMKLPEADRRDPAVLEELARGRVETGLKADDAVKLFVRYAQNEVSRIVGVQIALGIIAVLAGVLAALLISRSIVQPLQQCVALAGAIAAGDLRQQPLPVRSRDEVGQLTESFNAMLEALRAITTETRSTAAHLAASVQEILASIQEQASSTREQAAAVQEITTTVEEIGQSAQQVAEMAREVGSAADSIAGSGQTGLTAVQEATAAMEAIRSQTENVAETIVALSERTQAIGDIVSSVNEIAEQSNLVALNAAIEAAGAGEQGRRFSVVANEMKALADQAKEATKQVRSILEQTQRNISSSVLLTEEALKRVSAGRDKAATAEEVIRQMAGSVRDTSGSFQQVVGATGQQQIGLEQIAQGLQQIRQASVQAASGTDQLAKAAESLGQLGGTMTRLMEKYRL
ncbi:methyl-accepting chemotaxis protein [Oleisolibacter albus]|uniref:methyl-accepting chemotaxis protein n=1 Tax=Oleisolibacter albus TaxID=2171757 RepID=UPI00138FEC0B|nr:methyl-accepting chemotaxis protein [Oleisolibacter albus]